ncbi:hypothetical protein M752DRAFT_67247 [Aspergillus phoenicis ATCC 13157]|uniref:Uncharacterized protein n=1 Tax=Aspergillus phoenicis ATCC 13157 TaxID=1353007 RepID=A0A370PXM3_ASPPH|nr:hypothetical protein M752DRAFT_67247 [Aspergillus phoenicis ATCC 13157]
MLQKYRATQCENKKNSPAPAPIRHQPSPYGVALLHFRPPNPPERARKSFSFFTQARQQDALFGKEAKMDDSYLLSAYFLGRNFRATRSLISL